MNHRRVFIHKAFSSICPLGGKSLICPGAHEAHPPCPRLGWIKRMCPSTTPFPPPPPLPCTLHPSGALGRPFPASASASPPPGALGQATAEPPGGLFCSTESLVRLGQITRLAAGHQDTLLLASAWGCRENQRTPHANHPLTSNPTCLPSPAPAAPASCVQGMEASLGLQPDG